MGILKKASEEQGCLCSACAQWGQDAPLQQHPEQALLCSQAIQSWLGSVPMEVSSQRERLHLSL